MKSYTASKWNNDDGKQSDGLLWTSRVVKLGALAAAAYALYCVPEWCATHIPSGHLKAQQLKEVKHDVTARHDSVSMHGKSVVKLELK